jgi:hypothetical protein
LKEVGQLGFVPLQGGSSNYCEKTKVSGGGGVIKRGHLPEEHLSVMQKKKKKETSA